jgi:hypothetical protein
MGRFVKLVSAVDRLLQVLLHPIGITSTEDGLEWRSQIILSQQKGLALEFGST